MNDAICPVQVPSVLPAFELAATALRRHVTLAASVPDTLQLLSDILGAMFDCDTGLIAVYDSLKKDGSVLCFVDTIVDRLIETLLDSTEELMAFGSRVIQQATLPDELSAVLRSATRPWTDPELTSCLEGEPTILHEPERLAHQRYNRLSGSDRLQEAAYYAESQKMYIEASLMWCRLNRLDRIVTSDLITKLTWAQRIQVRDALGADQDNRCLFRYTQAIFDRIVSPVQVTPLDIPHVVSLLVGRVRYSLRPELKTAIVSAVNFLRKVSPLHPSLLRQFIQELSSINPTASSFVANDIATIYVSQAAHDTVSSEQLLRLIITTVATYGDMERQKALVAILVETKLPSTLLLALITCAMKVNTDRGHYIAWQLILQLELSELRDTEVARVSDVTDRLHDSEKNSASTFHLALFQRRPSRTAYNRLSDYHQRQALQWIRGISITDHNLDSLILIADLADDHDTINRLATNIVTLATTQFPFRENPLFFRHLFSNANVKSWLAASPSAIGTQLMSLCGSVMATLALSQDIIGDDLTPLRKVIDDLPAVLSRPILEAASRAVISRYTGFSALTRPRRRVIQDWIATFRSLCLASDGKSRWTGFQNSSLRALKSGDALYRELRAAGLLKAVV